MRRRGAFTVGPWMFGPIFTVLGNVSGVINGGEMVR